MNIAYLLAENSMGGVETQAKMWLRYGAGDKKILIFWRGRSQQQKPPVKLGIELPIEVPILFLEDVLHGNAYRSTWWLKQPLTYKLAKIVVLEHILDRYSIDGIHVLSAYLYPLLYFFLPWYRYLLSNPPIRLVTCVQSSFAYESKQYGFWLNCSRLCSWDVHVVNAFRYWRQGIENHGKPFVLSSNGRKKKQGFLPRRLSFLPNMVDTQRFLFKPLPPLSPFYCLAVGRLHRLKRWHLLLEMLHDLAPELSQLRLTFLGEGPEKPALQRMRDVLGLQQRVTFLSASHQVPEIIAAHHLLLHPSQVEGCPNAVLEAMACGRPVLACDAGDVPGILQASGAGLVCLPHRQSLADAVRFLVQRPTQMIKMGQQGANYIHRYHRPAALLASWRCLFGS